MKNYTNSDYAVNKNAKGIVYRFADQTIEITLEDYLHENPGKTEADFIKLKTISDNDYHSQDRSNYNQTRKNLQLSGLGEFGFCSTLSSEIDITERDEQITKQKKLVMVILEKLTDVQRRRYLMYRAYGMSTREIAAQEGVKQRSVMDSIEWAEKKIKKVLKNFKK